MDSFGRFATGVQVANPRVVNGWLDVLSVEPLLATAGWRYENSAHHHDRFGFAIVAYRGVERDGRVWLTLEFEQRHGGALSLADCVAAAQLLILPGARVGFGMRSATHAIIQSCLEDGGDTNCALAHEEVERIAAALGFYRLVSLEEREKRQNQHESRVGMPLLSPATPAKIDAPEGWVGHECDFKHVRTGCRVAVEKAFEKAAPDVKWRLVTLKAVAPIVDTVALTAEAFLGRARRARILPPAQGARSNMTLAFRLDGADPCDDGCEMAPNAISQYIASRPDLASVEPWTPHEARCWQDGARECSSMHGDWHPLQIQGLRMFRNAYAGLLGWSNVYTADNLRTVHVHLVSGRWTLARVMEGGTSFIRRGTPIRVQVNTTEDHVGIEFRHTCNGPPLAGSMPLEESAIEHALRPWAKLLADARVPKRLAGPALRSN